MLQFSITLENGAVINTDSATGGAQMQDYAFINSDGIILYYNSGYNTAGAGIIRPYSKYASLTGIYLVCDGLGTFNGSLNEGFVLDPFVFEYDYIVSPAVWGWVEKEITVIGWQQHDAQPRAVAKVESTDGTKYILVDNTGTTIEGDVIAKNNLTVKGNLYVEGTEVVTDVETVQSEDDFIKLRFNNPAALGEGQSGLQVLNFDGNGAVMYLVVSGDGILRLGLGNELEPVTTRDEAAQMIDGAVTVWNAQAQKIKTGPAAADLVTSEEVKTLKALSLADYNAITTKDINTAYLII